MAYQTLYLRWRPSSFDTLVGQAPVKQALMNALSSGRIAHAYLFTGPRGTGKTTTARIFAKALNCQNGPTNHPCGECLNCRQITDGSALDVQELDAASNRGVDDIKNLNKNADFAPVNCRYKVYIIDEAHMLTTEACNALLKTLEEPPEHVVFILATTEPQKILPTIHSRCQRFDFHPITQEEIVAHLQKVAEGSDIKAEKEALELIAAASEGGMRDALSLLEQCGVMAETVTAETVRSVRGIIGREILRELVGAVGQREVASALTIFDRLLMQGKDISQILIELSGYMRALLLYRATPEYQPIYVTDTAEELAKLAELYTGERILAAQEIIHQAMNELRFTARGRVTAEMCLYDLCREDNRTLKTLAARVNQLEREMAALKAGGLTAAVPQEPAGITAPAVVANVKPAEASKTKSVEVTKAKQAEASNAQPAEPVEKPVQQKPKEEAPVVPVKTPQPQPVATEAKKEKAKTTVTEETKVAASPAGNNPSAIPPVVPGNTDVPGAGNGSSDQGYTPYAGDWATGDEYWTRTMEILKAERKQSIAACASHGYVMAYENQTLIVGFKMKYLCERLQKPDYREVVEDVLLRVARVPVRLQCVEDTGGKPVAKSSAKKSSAAAPGKSNTPAKGEAQPNVFDSTKKAMEMFNATLHKV
ncbi:DNA polymerase III subunit gamma/tau [uncultured Succiniclasticum sp.]|uniref:DNA polymerase III subunit gamma/tau n=1 Tax=uncultured Succiniclasticum sp. TaxID=1500547 RepID=UPI0025E5237B|nr:DNA polymerase III subunit gamma/tau [uncultured Succiniclasticum sp.]